MVAANRTASGATYYQYPVYDHRGTVVRLTDADGDAAVATYEYDAWGTPLQASVGAPTAPNRFRYQSNWIDLVDSGGELLLSRTRVYHAGVGRFVQRDRAFLARKYLAFAGHPTGAVDSDGGITQWLQAVTRDEAVIGDPILRKAAADLLRNFRRLKFSAAQVWYYCCHDDAKSFFEGAIQQSDLEPVIEERDQGSRLTVESRGRAGAASAGVDVASGLIGYTETAGASAALSFLNMLAGFTRAGAAYGAGDYDAGLALAIDTGLTATGGGLVVYGSLAGASAASGPIGWALIAHVLAKHFIEIRGVASARVALAESDRRYCREGKSEFMRRMRALHAARRQTAVMLRRLAGASGTGGSYVAAIADAIESLGRPRTQRETRRQEAEQWRRDNIPFYGSDPDAEMNQRRQDEERALGIGQGGVY